jgi:RNA polymerase subunit RPABC4/transcription elongation factor Spt4
MSGAIPSSNGVSVCLWCKRLKQKIRNECNITHDEQILFRSWRVFLLIVLY